MNASAPSLRIVFVVGAALLALWALSFGLSYADLGRASLAVALAIALAKAALVALFFMELVRERLSVVLAMVAAGALVMMLIGFTVADVLTRDPAPLAVPGAPAAGGPADLPSR